MVIDLNEQRERREMDQFVNQHLDIVGDLIGVVKAHLEAGRDPYQIIHALAAVLVDVGVRAQTNGASLINMVSTEAQNYPCWEDVEPKFKDWFLIGISAMQNGLATYDPERPDYFANKTNGMIVEFKQIEQARAFAAAVKSRWGLASRVFDDSAAANAAHVFPWQQTAPVVHVDRPTWALEARATQEETDAAYALEREIDELAETMGGEFVGT